MTAENRPLKADECSNCLAIERTSCHYFSHPEMNKCEDYNFCPQQNCFLGEWEEWESFPAVIGYSCKKWDLPIIWDFSPLHNSVRGKSVRPQLGTHALLIQDFLLFTAAQIGILPPFKRKTNLILLEFCSSFQKCVSGFEMKQNMSTSS